MFIHCIIVVFFLVFICPPTCGFLIMMLYCLENPTLCIDNAVHVHKACLSFWNRENWGEGLGEMCHLSYWVYIELNVVLNEILVP